MVEMPEEEAVALMRSSKNEIEWKENCTKVLLPNGTFPKYWFRAIITSGLMSEVAMGWVARRVYPLGYNPNEEGGVAVPAKENDDA